MANMKSEIHDIGKFKEVLQEALNSRSQVIDPWASFIDKYIMEYGPVTTAGKNALTSVYLAYKYVNELLTEPFIFKFVEVVRDGSFEERGDGFLKFVRYTATKKAKKNGYINIEQIKGGLSEEEVEDGAKKFVNWVENALGENGKKLLEVLELL